MTLDRTEKTAMLKEAELMLVEAMNLANATLRMSGMEA